MKGLQRTQMRVHLSSHHLLLQINSLYWSEFSLNSCFLNEKCNYSFLNQFCSDQSLSDAQLFATPWTAARQASLSMTNSWACSNSCPLSRWFHPAISSSAVPFFSSLQSSLASGSFPVSQFFASGGQSIGALSSASVLPMNIQDWFPLRLTVWYLGSPRDSQESSPTPQFKSINSLALSFLHGPVLTSVLDYGKSHSCD